VDEYVDLKERSDPVCGEIGTRAASVSTINPNTSRDCPFCKM